MDYAKYIKRIRKEMDMTQREFAAAIGVKRATVAGYEVGNIKPSTDVFIILLALEEAMQTWNQ